MRLRHVLRTDLADAAGVLARSFFDDPQMGFLFPDVPTRGEDLTRMFELCLGAAMRRGNTFVLDGPTSGLLGAVLWSPPDVAVMSDEESAPFGPLMASRYGDEGLARLGAMGEAMSSHHPQDTHFYLWIVGIEPSAQGQGLGESMLAPVLTRCDSDGVAAYLESSNPRNIGFYERLGFTTVSEFHPDSGPLFTGMWRDPRRT